MNDHATSCAAVRELLLEADAAALRGEDDSRIAQHLHDCPACAADARRILSAQQELAEALATLSATSGGLPAVSEIADVRSFHDTRRFRRRLLAAAAPLAAAAVLVLFLMRQRSGPELATLEPLPAVAMMTVSTPVVNVAEGGDVAVMQTSNPNITVVWYLNRERQ